MPEQLMDSNKIIIGIPAIKEDMKSFESMYMSLRVSTWYADKIIIVTPDVEEFENSIIKNLASTSMIKVEIIKNPGKTPLEAYNKLFEIALKERSDLFLTQTDVVFPRLYMRDWLKMFSDASKNEGIGAVTSINGYGVSGPDYLDGFKWLGGWCTYYPFRTLEKIGGYDSNFPNVQYGVDIDHTYRIFQEGLKIIIVNYWVDHHQMNSREHDNHPDTERFKKECALYFRKKWKVGEFKDV